MKNIRAALLFAAALVAAAVPAWAQTFPTVPSQSVIGRLGTPGASGPSQAIPFATLFPQMTALPSSIYPFLGPIFLGDTTHGGTYLVPGGSTASTPLTTKNSVWNASNTSLPFTGTAFGKTLLNTIHAGSHVGTQLFSSAINAQITGSGANGPIQGDYGLAINSEKIGWQTNVGAAGEIGGLYVRVRQNAGASTNQGDSSGLLIDINNLGSSGFMAAVEAVTANLSNSTGIPLKTVNTQVGVIDTNSNKTYGYVATATLGALDYGVFVQSQSGGGEFANPFAYSNASGIRWAVDKNAHTSIYPDDNTSSNFFTLRNNGGAFSLVNTAGTLEFMQVNQLGAASLASLALTSSPLGATSGGTGHSSYAVGDILYASTTSAISRLADVATGNALISGGVGAAPSWGKITSSHITAAALTKTDDTNVTLTLGGSPSTALVNAASVTVGWTGTLAAARLNSNVVQGITNGTNITGSIAAQNLTLGWTGTLATSLGGWGRDMTSAPASFTPTLTCGSGTLTSSSATGSSITVGKMVYVDMSITITTNGTCAGTLNVTNLPVAALRTNSILPGMANAGMVMGFLTASSTTMQIIFFNNTYPAADGYTIGLNGWYQSL